MSVRRRKIATRIARDEQRAREHADFKHFFESIKALIARKEAAGETAITHQEIYEATRLSLPGTGEQK